MGSTTSTVVVQFGSTTATVSAHSATSISAIAPSGPTGKVAISVTVDGVPADTLTEDHFFVYSSAVQTISPRFGTAGKSVILRGFGFGTDKTAVAVMFGSTPGTVSSVTDRVIKATAPAGTSVVTISVTINGTPVEALADTRFGYTPTITNITQKLSSGTSPVWILAIKGAGFATTTTPWSLMLGATPVNQQKCSTTVTSDCVVSKSATQITVRPPTGLTGSQAIQLSVNGTQAGAITNKLVVFDPGPVVTG